MQNTCNVSCCHLWRAPLYNIFPHYLINVTIFAKQLLNTKCVFWFPLQLLSETSVILRRIQRDVIMNKELWKRTKQPRIDLQIRKRKWGWLGHTLRKPSDDIARRALEWNHQGKRGRGRPRNTWRGTVLEEAKGVKKTWAEIKTDAKNRVRWRILVEALCSAAEWRDIVVV
jgi:hypothetical protein